MNLNKLKKNEYFWLLLIIIGGFLIRLWLLHNRWINPDEGAHLMDGKLALQGLIPLVDFDSRQPLYVYIIALVLNVFGASYTVGRFIPLVSSLGIIIFIFLISKKMFDGRVALLASAIYAFTPFSIFWSVMVHMQPVSVLLNCIGVYCVVSYAKGGKNMGLLVLGGVFFALAYYVRETSLALLIATFFYFLVVYGRRLKKLIMNYGALLTGYFVVCALAFAFYSRYVGLAEIWDSSINPFEIVASNLDKVLLLVGVASTQTEVLSARVEGFRVEDQTWSSTVGQLISSAHFNSFLYVGLAFSLLMLVYLLFIRKQGEERKEIVPSICLLYFWFISLAVLYSYWLLYRGFYMQYFEEFLPPLVILLAFTVVYSLSKFRLEKNLWKKAAVVALLLVTIFITHNGFQESVELNSVVMGLYVLLTVSVLAGVWFFPRLGLKSYVYASLICFALLVLSLLALQQTYESPYFVRGLLFIVLLILTYFLVFVMSQLKPRENFREILGFIFVSLVLSAFVLSFAVSGYRMNLGFSSTWSPKVVREVSDHLMLNSNTGIEVISGGVIWEFESGYKPFMNLSHPLSLRPGVSAKEYRAIQATLHKSPPEFIVLDGYTEQTYLRHIGGLEEMIEKEYRLTKTVGGDSRYPVEVYKLVEHARYQQTKGDDF